MSVEEERAYQEIENLKNQILILKNHMEILIRNRNMAFDLTRECLEINSELREQVKRR